MTSEGEGMNLLDERLHGKRIPWKRLEAEGYEPKRVMLEAQKQRMWLLARRAHERIVNTRGPQDEVQPYGTTSKEKNNGARVLSDCDG